MTYDAADVREREAISPKTKKNLRIGSALRSADFSVLSDPNRLSSLYRTGLLGTPAEKSFDRLTRLAAGFLDAPLALVNLIDKDRQLSKSCHTPAGWPDGRVAALKDSFCKYPVALRQPVCFEDARELEAVNASACVTALGVVSYAGVPLITSEGQALGALCVADFEPRSWTEEEIQTLSDLADAVTAEIELRTEVAHRREAEQRWAEAASQLRALSLTDELTGLANRRGFDMMAEALLAQPLNPGEQWALIVLDLDNMKTINDTYGHASGDDALVETARRLRQMVPEADVLARLGGDEFAALLKSREAAPPDVLEAELQSRFDGTDPGGKPYRVLASIGLATTSPGQVSGLAELTRAADERMYAVKGQRKPASGSRASGATPGPEGKAHLAPAQKLASAFALRKPRGSRR